MSQTNAFCTNDLLAAYHEWLQSLEVRRSEDERAIESRFGRGEITTMDESLVTYLRQGLDDVLWQVTTNYQVTTKTNAPPSSNAPPSWPSFIVRKMRQQGIGEDGQTEFTNTTSWLTRAADFTMRVMTMSPQCRAETVSKLMNYCSSYPDMGTTAKLSEAGVRPALARETGPQAVLTNLVEELRKGTLSTEQFIPLIPLIPANIPPPSPTAPREEQATPKDEQRMMLLTGMELALNAKYCSDFAGFASVQYRFDTFEHSGTLVVGRMVPYEEGLDVGGAWERSQLKKRTKDAKLSRKGHDLFYWMLSQWPNSAYVDSIDPQMYAQNISDVSSQAKLLELALTVNAAIGKPASLQNTTKFLHESQTLLQAIKRQPLAVGFASGEQEERDKAEFGWLLGPQFDIKDGNPVFSQTATRQSFAVSIVVPAWWDHLYITNQQWWLNSGGKPKYKFWSQIKTNEMQEVWLPRDMEALTSALQRQSSPRPSPTIAVAEQALRAATNGDQTLLVRGRELWRNPAVIVGSTPADTVDLLPDMRGVIAHFKSMPTTYGPQADLRVVTSFGVDTLEKSVRIISPDKTTPVKTLAKLITPFASHQGPPLIFLLDGMPSAFAGFSLKIGTKAAPGKWVTLADNEYKYVATNHTLSITLNTGPAPTYVPVPAAMPPPAPPPAAPAGATPTVYTVELGLRSAPSEDPMSLIPTSQPSFIYFPMHDWDKPEVQAVNVTYPPPAGAPSPLPILVAPAGLVTKQQLYVAYPGFEKSVINGTASMVLEQHGGILKSHPLPFRDNGVGPVPGPGWIVPTDGLTRDDLPSGVFDTFTIWFQTPDEKSASIQAQKAPAGPVTVTGHQ